MGPVVIGIAGGTASGKSTFCNLLVEELSEYRVEVIRTDQYFRRPLPKMIAPLTGEEHDDFNHPDSLDIDRFMEDFKALLERHDEIDIILVEGLMVLYFEEIRREIDLKIFIELDADERMYRRIKRNMEKMGWTMEQIADYYLDCVKYREKQYVLRTKIYADIILNGNNLDGMAKEVVVSWVLDEMS